MNAMQKRKFYAEIAALAERADAISEERIAWNARKILEWDGTIDEVKTTAQANAILSELERKIYTREQRFLRNTSREICK